MDFNYFIQNFTAFRYNVTIKPKEKHTILYKFRVDQRLEPREYGISINVFYKSVADNFTFAQSFFNETIRCVEPPQVFDFKTLFAYFLIISIFGAVIYGVYKIFLEKTFKKMRKEKENTKVQIQEDNSEINEDNLPQHIRQFNSKKKNKKKDEKKDEKKEI
jgi:predicted membrane protein